MISNDEKNEVVELFARVLEKHNCGDIEMTPISVAAMENASGDTVVITEEAYIELFKIRQKTSQTDKEISYLMFGEEKTGGIVWLDKVISSYQAANTTNIDAIIKPLDAYVKSIQNGDYNNGNRQIVCHGHTQGRNQKSSNFSFGDLISYFQLNNTNSLFENRQIETMAMIIPQCGDFNFIMYDNDRNCEGFYIFPNVYVRDNGGNLYQLPAYQEDNYNHKNSKLKSK